MAGPAESGVRGAIRPQGSTEDPGHGAIVGAESDEPAASHQLRRGSRRTAGEVTRGGARSIETQTAATRLGIRTLSDIPSGPPTPLKLGRLDPTGHTILFGPGGVGKGTLASDWIAKLTALGEVVLIVDYEDHPSEWARRIGGLGGDPARVFHVCPASANWEGKGGAIWEHADDLALGADEVKATYIVIDSIVVACGGAEPKDAPSPSRYAAALARIGRPTLSLGHVTKSDDGRYPFGSAFWHNLARVTWSLTYAKGGTVLANRKANNYPAQSDFIVSFSWTDDRPTEIVERPRALKMADRIAMVLARSEPLTVDDITTAINALHGPHEPPVKQDTIRAALRRGAQAEPPVFAMDHRDGRALWVRADG